MTAPRRVRLGVSSQPEEESVPKTDVRPVEQPKRMDRVRASGKLRCGVVNHPPLSAWRYVKGSVEYTGYYPELARQVGRETDLDIEFCEMDWGVLPHAFTEHNLDLVLSIFDTTVRQEFADFAVALHKVGVGGVMSGDRPPLMDVSDLSKPDIRVGVVIGEVGWEYITRELRLPRRQVVQIDSSTLETAFSALVSGDVDVAIVDNLTCADFVKSHSAYQHVFTDDPLYLCKNAIMVPKGEPEFLRWVDTVFLNARSDPALHELETETLKQTHPWVRKFR